LAVGFTAGHLAVEGRAAFDVERFIDAEQLDGDPFEGDLSPAALASNQFHIE
jgi:hypothetical protein